MSRVGRSFLTAALAVCILTPVGAPAVQAHNWRPPYFSARWYSPTNPQGTKWINMYIADYITGATFNRLIDAAHSWDNIDTLADFKYISQVDPGLGCAAGYNKNVLYVGPHDGVSGVLAWTDTCWIPGVYGNRVYNFSTKFDNAENWYAGTAQVPPALSADLWSVAAHEAGHALWWHHHFPEGSYLCPQAKFDPARQTMCAGILDNDTSARSLANHDRHTFRGAYGPPFPLE